MLRDADDPCHDMMQFVPFIKHKDLGRSSSRCQLGSILEEGGGVVSLEGCQVMWLLAVVGGVREL